MKISFKWDQTMQCSRVIRRPFLLSPNNVVVNAANPKLNAMSTFVSFRTFKSRNYFLIGILKGQGYYRIRSRMQFAPGKYLNLLMDLIKRLIKSWSFVTVLVKTCYQRSIFWSTFSFLSISINEYFSKFTNKY